ncbi:type IV secretion system protein, partial [Candidatus Saccharibacteria bacterium]|nr:type IV secretion system protein [Candidatus Saccharibacteria bacterium]
DGINSEVFNIKPGVDCPKADAFYKMPQSGNGLEAPIRFYNFIVNTVFQGKDPAAMLKDPAILYYFYFDTFIVACAGNNQDNTVEKQGATHAPTFEKEQFVYEGGKSNQTPDMRTYILGIKGKSASYNANASNLTHSWRIGLSADSGTQMQCAGDNGKATAGTILSNATLGSRVNAAILALDSDATKTVGANTTTNNQNNNNQSSKDDCKANAGTMGWLTCSIMEAVADGIQLMWNWVGGAMVIPSGFFSGSTGLTSGAAYEVWSNFRNVANILFVILFLVVIFSQLTGIGIKNYGIKKILPKLIITALLVNLSYFLCVIAVDLSNIIGASLNDFLGSLGPGATASGAGALGAVLGTGATGVSIVSSAIGMVGIANPGVILTILIVFVVVLIFMFILFTILAIRKIAVLILLVISPIAFLLYLLPGTNGMFKKWWKMFYTLLILYPVCGLVMGMGKFAGDLIIATSKGIPGGWFIQLLAGFMPFLPVIIIPSLVKGIMGLFKEMGAKLSGGGLGGGGGGLGGLGKKAVDKASNSQVSKALSQRTQDRKLNKLAEHPNNFRSRALNKLSGSNYGTDRAAQAIGEQEKRQATATAGATLLGKREGLSVEGYKKRLNDAIDRNDRTGIESNQNILADLGGEGRQALREVTSDGVSSGRLKGKTAEVYNNNLAANATMKEKATDVWKTAQKGMEKDSSGVMKYRTTVEQEAEDLGGKASYQELSKMDSQTHNSIWENGGWNSGTVQQLNSNKQRTDVSPEKLKHINDLDSDAKKFNVPH